MYNILKIYLVPVLLTLTGLIVEFTVNNKSVVFGVVIGIIISIYAWLYFLKILGVVK